MTKVIGILGSTGSIGNNTLDIARHDKNIKIKFLSADKDWINLAKQAKEFQPEYIAINDSSNYKLLKSELNKYNIEIFAGKDAINKIAQIKCDIVIAAITGCAGLMPIYNAIKVGSNIALANKESLVCAGDLIMQMAAINKINIIPIDSEHNAIMQVLNYDNKDLIDKIILTASGGPFLNYDIKELKNVSIKEALNHPNWKMGKKVTIDCATMFNKAFEIIEAKHIFGFSTDKIEAIIHPESLIHGMVSYKNGSTLAQLSNHDMRIAIAIALNWPNYKKSNLSTLDFTKISHLSFMPIDNQKFPAINLIRQVDKIGQNAMTILNAANEIAVKYFLQGLINFSNIYNIVEEIITNHSFEKITDIDEIIEYDKITRLKTIKLIEKKLLEAA